MSQDCVYQLVNRPLKNCFLRKITYLSEKPVLKKLKLYLWLLEVGGILTTIQVFVYFKSRFCVFLQQNSQKI